jgi:hypothetical protein
VEDAVASLVNDVVEFVILLVVTEDAADVSAADVSAAPQLEEILLVLVESVMML